MLPTVSKVFLLDALRTQLNASGLDLWCYSNDITPDAESVIGDFTPAPYEGFEAIALQAFPAASADDGDALVIGAQHTFELTGVSSTGEVYGYCISDEAKTQLWVAKRFPPDLAGITIATIGQKLHVFPTLRLEDVAA